MKEHLIGALSYRLGHGFPFHPIPPREVRLGHGFRFHPIHSEEEYALGIDYMI